MPADGAPAVGCRGTPQDSAATVLTSVNPLLWGRRRAEAAAGTACPVQKTSWRLSRQNHGGRPAQGRVKKISQVGSRNAHESRALGWWGARRRAAAGRTAAAGLLAGPPPRPAEPRRGPPGEGGGRHPPPAAVAAAADAASPHRGGMPGSRRSPRGGPARSRLRHPCRPHHHHPMGATQRYIRWAAPGRVQVPQAVTVFVFFSLSLCPCRAGRAACVRRRLRGLGMPRLARGGGGAEAGGARRHRHSGYPLQAGIPGGGRRRRRDFGRPRQESPTLNHPPPAPRARSRAEPPPGAPPARALLPSSGATGRAGGGGRSNSQPCPSHPNTQPPPAPPPRTDQCPFLHTRCRGWGGCCHRAPPPAGRGAPWRSRRARRAL